MPRGRVSRDDAGMDDEQDFSLPTQIGGDVALVGDGNSGHNVDGTDDGDESWDLPQEGQQPQQRQQQPQDDDGYDEEDARLAYSDEEDDDGQQRPSRRMRRNARRRQLQESIRNENAELRAQLESLTGVVNRLASGQSGLAVSSLDSQISTLENSLRITDEEMANAVKTQDGDTYAKAQRLRDEIVGRLYAAKAHRDRMAQAAAQFQRGGVVPQPQQPQPQPQAQQPQAPDPRIVAAVEDRFDRFCERFPWFDPQSQDTDSNIVRAIDQELAASGFQRHQPAFWQELEKRMAGYGLRPQRNANQDDGDEDDTPPPPRRNNVMGRPLSRPPTVSGRSTGAARNGFHLSEAQTSILREEGLLEQNLSDADKAKRERIINSWRKGSQALRRGAV